ncbi:hypothetical protein ACH5RR_027935 [Cinchona calisaya]|uniref:Protein NDR1-like n=1 Tax=Cinchona calisaya TaxID=153742 RepID=A0ABD2YPB5_9GENT
MSDYSHGGGGCFRCCCNFILTLGLTALFLWLSLRVTKPSCSIENFYLPPLNTTDNSTTTRNNHTLYFDLRLKNEMKDKGVGYGAINLTFFYGGAPNNNNNSLPIANYSVPSFYQGHGKKARRKELVQTYGVPWEAAYRAVSTGSTVTFRVRLVTRVRYKILFWYTKRHTLKVGANLDVNNYGEKVNKKGIRLKSGSPEHFHRLAPLGLSIVLYFLVLLL